MNIVAETPDRNALVRFARTLRDDGFARDERIGLIRRAFEIGSLEAEEIDDAAEPERARVPLQWRPRGLR